MNLRVFLIIQILIIHFQINILAQTGESEAGNNYESKTEQLSGEFNSFIDSRDGKTYKTIKIGEQTWMAENLNFDSKIGSWAYNNDSRLAESYGRLYTWQASLGACPDGWRLPGDFDWDQLIDYLGGPNEAGEKMKAMDSTHWKNPDGGGNNLSGFTALPAGYRGVDGNFLDLGVLTFFWSSSEENQFYAWSRGFYVNYTGIYRNLSNKNFAASVRCIKEE